MKKIVIAAVCALTAASLVGCASNKVQLENVDTTKVLSPDQLEGGDSDFSNDIQGLEDYFKKLGYIPDKTKGDDKMMANVIGAQSGRRYVFNVNNNTVAVELYEYEPDNLNADAKRVLDQIQKSDKNEFKVFADDRINEGRVYQGIVSESGKFLMIYNDPTDDQKNISQKKLAENAFINFHSSKQESTQESKQESTQESKQESAQESNQESAQESKQESTQESKQESTQ